MSFRIPKSSDTRLRFNKSSKSLSVEIPAQQKRYFLILLAVFAFAVITFLLSIRQEDWLPQGILLILFVSVFLFGLQSFRESLYLDRERFLIRKLVFNIVIYQQQGRTIDIEDVFCDTHSVSNRSVTGAAVVLGRETTFKLVAIQTRNGRYMFGSRLTEDEANWLVQEICNWIRM